MKDFRRLFRQLKLSKGIQTATDLKTRVSDTPQLLTSGHQRPDETYVYAPIRDSMSIRLLKLYPGRGEDPLIGELVLLPLSESPGHKALSYVWGDSTKSETIICDGKSLSITQSLRRGLEAVRLRADVRILWVDQICINQDDMLERSLQVQFMHKIYKASEYVLVWLGTDEDQHAEMAFSLMLDLESRFADEKRAAAFTKKVQGDLSQFNTAKWKALREFFRRPWVSSLCGQTYGDAKTLVSSNGFGYVRRLELQHQLKSIGELL
jgi:Heterokaryon incompatibility protein (HET)